VISSVLDAWLMPFSVGGNAESRTATFLGEESAWPPTLMVDATLTG
jgi:hypothetical protein